MRRTSETLSHVASKTHQLKMHQEPGAVSFDILPTMANDDDKCRFGKLSSRSIDEACIGPDRTTLIQSTRSKTGQAS